MPSILKHTPKHHTPFQLINQSNKQAIPSITPNYLLIQPHLSKTQLNILTYIILKASNTNRITINTSFIQKYIKLSKFIQNQYNNNPTTQANTKETPYSTPNTLNNKPKLKKKDKGNFSYNNVLGDIIFLIDVHAIIQLKPNTAHYLVNPVYSHARSTKTRVKAEKLALNNYINALNSRKFKPEMLRFFAVDWYLNTALRALNDKRKANVDLDDEGYLATELLEWWRVHKYIYHEIEAINRE